MGTVNSTNLEQRTRTESNSPALKKDDSTKWAERNRGDITRATEEVVKTLEQFHLNEEETRSKEDNVPPEALPNLLSNQETLSKLVPDQEALYNLGSYLRDRNQDRTRDDYDEDYIEPLGRNCDLCEEDLTYDPEALESEFPNPAGAAVLVCGHAFHSKCFEETIEDEQLNEPLCILCASMHF